MPVPRIGRSDRLARMEREAGLTNDPNDPNNLDAKLQRQADGYAPDRQHSKPPRKAPDVTVTVKVVPASEAASILERLAADGQAVRNIPTPGMKYLEELQPVLAEGKEIIAAVDAVSKEHDVLLRDIGKLDLRALDLAGYDRGLLGDLERAVSAVHSGFGLRRTVQAQLRDAEELRNPRLGEIDARHLAGLVKHYIQANRSAADTCRARLAHVQSILKQLDQFAKSGALRPRVAIRREAPMPAPIQTSY